MSDPQAAALSEVTKSFRGGIRALDRLDFEARFGEVVAIIGANGSGKTTLLRVLFGALRPDRGSARTLGVDPAPRPRSLRRQVAYVPQQLALDPEMTGRETLELFCTLHGLAGADRRGRARDLARSFGLESVSGRRVSTYSGGMRRRLHLALGMVHEPRLLLLDEPTSGLDPDGRASLWATARGHADEGRAVVIVTHDLDEVTRHCDRAVLLSQGSARVDVSPREIIARHGCATYEVSLGAAAPPGEPLRKRLSSVAGVEHVEVRDDRIRLRLIGPGDPAATVLRSLDEAKVPVTAYRHERPSLASAYARLTGRDLDADGSNRPGGGR